MRILALATDPDHVCLRYRVQPMNHYGFTVEVKRFESTLFGRLMQYREARAYDAVLLQRTLLNRFELQSLKHSANALLFDFDDAIWRRDSYQPDHGRSAKLLRRFRATMQAADGVLAGNPFLAQAAREHGCRGTVIVAPSCLPIEDYQRANHDRSEPVMVWIGSSSTLKSLEANAVTFRALGRANPGLRFKLICDRFASFDPLSVECVPWQATTEKAELASADIGVAIMPEDDWSRGKCGVKVLQYLAAGLPVIANPVGVHQSMVIPGTNGFLPRNTAEWLDAVEALRDRGLRKRMGDASRRIVEADYSLAAAGRAWGQLFETLARRRAC